MSPGAMPADLVARITAALVPGSRVAPGAVSIAVELKPDGSAELVGDGLYCLAMFARAQKRPRPSLEAVLERALLDAMGRELKCRPCRTWTRHVPIPGERPLYRCSACTGVREFEVYREKLATAVDQPDVGQLALWLPSIPLERWSTPRARRSPSPRPEPRYLPGFAVAA